MLERNRELHRFTQGMISLRKAHPALRHPYFAGVTKGDSGELQLSWHGIRAWNVDWSGTSRVLAFQARLHGSGHTDVLYVALNMYWEALPFEPPVAESGLAWHVVANTGQPSPFDIYQPGDEPLLENPNQVLVGGRSVVILTAR